VVWTARLALALVFALSAWAKFRDLPAFVGVVSNYRVLPERLSVPIAHAVPIVEAAVAAGLLAESTRAIAGGWAIALLVLFSLAMGVNLLRGRTEIDCGCFGSALRQRLGWDLLARNGLLLAVAAWVATAGAPARELVWMDRLTVATAAPAIVLLSAAFGMLRRPGAAAEESSPGERS
jgi:hypothetical protein